MPPHEPGEGEADAKAVLGSLFGNISDSDDDTLGLAPAVRKVAAPPPQATIGEVTLAPVSPRVGAFTAKLPDAPAAGTYDVLQEIARGGMGAVIAVRDRRLGRTVAMKVIREMAADDDGTRARFIREARITGQLEHPNIVPVHELGRDAQQHDYFTMKLVQGQSLSAALAALRDDVAAGRGDAAFPLRSRLDVFGKICDAIAYANARGVIHRD
ncbi:MAG: protein kinase, partial [Planctomycetota bacterium]